MLFTPQLHRRRSSNFHKPWTGPFRVVRQPRYQGLTYTLSDESNGHVVVADRNPLKLWRRPDSAPGIEYASAVDVGEGEVAGVNGAFGDEEHGEDTLPVPKPEAQEVIGDAPLNEPLGEDARLRLRDGPIREDPSLSNQETALTIGMGVLWEPVELLATLGKLVGWK